MMFPTSSTERLAVIAVSAMIAGCGGAGSVTSAGGTGAAFDGSVLRTAFASSSIDATGGRVVYESSLDGAPGHGSILVFPASLRAHDPNPIRTFMDGAVRPDGMWVDKNGDLYVANIPQGGPTTGVYVFHPGSSHPYRHILNSLDNPEHVAVGSDGTVYVDQTACPSNIQGLCVTVFPPGKDKASHEIDLKMDGYAQSADEMAFDLKGDLLVEGTNFKQGTHVFSVNPQTFAFQDLGLNIGTGGPGLGVDGFGNIYAGSPGGILFFPPTLKNATRTLNASPYDIAVTKDGTVYGNVYGGIVEFAPGSETITNELSSPGNYGLGVAVGPAH
jgi:hypothetical protein